MIRSVRPKRLTRAAARISIPRNKRALWGVSMPPPHFMAMFFAITAMVARPPVVSAVPAAMTRAATMPSGSIFCDKANTKTRMAPEQGLIPAAKTAMPISRIEALSSAIGA